MADRISRASRSENMSKIKGRNTKPEIAVRKLLHKAGFRFRLHDKRLPGHPDIVLPKHKSAILVHGCFWHRHKGCKYAYFPKSNKEFWNSKFEENVHRDNRNIKELEDLGWKVVIVWECELREPDELQKRLCSLFK